MRLNLKLAAPQDAYEYAACHIACWRSAYKGIIPNDFLNNMLVERRAQSFEQNLAAQNGISTYMVTFEKKTVGILVFGKCRDEDKPQAGEIMGLYLTENLWGKGYGRELMNHAVCQLKLTGYCEVTLWVLEENIRARRFYEKCGFVFDGTRKELIIGKPLLEIRYSLT